MQALTLIHSGLEHVDATGHAISSGRVFLAHTAARTATEHLLRVQHLLDTNATPAERTRRRLNEWLYAIIESDYRRTGLLNTDVFTSGALDPNDLGPQKAELLAQVESRATAIGETITTTGTGKRGRARVPYVLGTAGRDSSMKLAEVYTAGGANGIPSFTMRGHSALVHGTEIGILACFADDSPPDATLGDVIVPQPRPMEPPTLAFSLLGVLLTVVNSTDTIRRHFDWPPLRRVDARLERAEAAAIAIWSRAIETE